MELARGAAASTAGVDDGFRLPNPSTTHGRMMVDALRLELLKETIRQEFIVAELAKQRELGSEDQGDRRLEHNAGPLFTHVELQPTTLPHHDTSPVQQDGQLQHVPLSPELRLHDALMIRGGARVLKRRPAKERIQEWYQPPWRDRSRDDEDVSVIRIFKRWPAKERIVEWYKSPWHDRSGNEDKSLIQAQWSRKALSGVKRKRTAESSAPNKKRSHEQWTCALCHVNTSSEHSFKEHCAGKQHMSEWTKGTAELKKIATAEAHQSMQHNSWNCSICKVKCSSELDLENHLKGRRHQEKVEGLWGESKEIAGNDGFHEAGSYEKKVPQLADKNKRPASSWNCGICKISCTSKSDLDSHLGGKRHQRRM